MSGQIKETEQQALNRQSETPVQLSLPTNPRGRDAARVGRPGSFMRLRSDATVGFKVLARRWVVERTFGWLMHQRRLVRDYETTVSSAVAWIYIAMIRIQLRRLA